MHHAVITQASKEDILARLGKEGITVAQNPDVLVMTFTELSVDDARVISTYAFLKSLMNGKYFIITFDRAGNEAQNALLKVVEEAPGGSHFFLCTQNIGAIIPTLRSRCVVEAAEIGETTTEATEFLSLSYADRLSKIEKMVTASQRSQDRTPLREFARALVVAHPTRATLEALRYLEQNGSSPKLVLSHLAVTLPQV
jgi:DNA polymerase III, delta subunit